MATPIDRVVAQVNRIYATLRSKDRVAPISEGGAITAAAILLATDQIVAALDELRIELARRV